MQCGSCAEDGGGERVQSGFGQAGVAFHFHSQSHSGCGRLARLPRRKVHAKATTLGVTM